MINYIVLLFHGEHRTARDLKQNYGSVDFKYQQYRISKNFKVLPRLFPKMFWVPNSDMTRLIWTIPANQIVCHKETTEAARAWLRRNGRRM